MKTVSTCRLRNQLFAIKEPGLVRRAYGEPRGILPLVEALHVLFGLVPEHRGQPGAIFQGKRTRRTQVQMPV